MASRKVVGWAAVLTVVPTLIVSVSGYLDVKAELARLEAAKAKQEIEQENRDAALWRAYQDMVERWQVCVRGQVARPAAPAPAPPPPPDDSVAALIQDEGVALERNPLGWLGGKAETRAPRSAASKSLDALAKDFGYQPKN